MTDNTSLIPNKKTSKTIALICAAVIVVVGLVLVVKGNNDTSSTITSSPGNASFYISPDTQTLAKGQELTVSVWANSGDTSINTVEADLSYPSDYFDFIDVEGANSSFPFSVQGDAKNGVITIVRGTTNPVKSNSLVATIKLQAKDKAGTASINFTKNSKVFAKGGSKNILSKKTGAKYTVK